MGTFAITDIAVVDRHRTDLGDVAGLADSMRDVGQQQPITITSDMRLVAHERRLAAAKKLGWTTIEAKVVDGLADAALSYFELNGMKIRAERHSPQPRSILYEALLA
jgi:ParB-like chromosome segregation protein Spo0J